MQVGLAKYRFHTDPAAVYFVPGDYLHDALATAFSVKPDALCLTWQPQNGPESLFDWSDGPVEGFTHCLTTIVENGVSPTGVPYVRYAFNDDQGDILYEDRFVTLANCLGVSAGNLNSLWVRGSDIDERGLPKAEVALIYVQV